MARCGVINMLQAARLARGGGEPLPSLAPPQLVPPSSPVSDGSDDGPALVGALQTCASELHIVLFEFSNSMKPYPAVVHACIEARDRLFEPTKTR